MAASVTGRRPFRFYRRTDAAAVNVIGKGSQHRTINAMSNRIARSLSVSDPSNSATYLIGAASVSI